MSFYYDKQGKPLSRDEFIALCQLDGYRRIGSTDVARPAGALWVSTVWMGIDHGFGDSLPIIFETMVFPHGEWSELGLDRYPTLAAAEAGHRFMVERAKRGDFDAALLEWLNREALEEADG